MSGRGLGGRSVTFSQEVASRFFTGAGTWMVYLEREATLSPDLSEVSTRRLRNVRVISADLDLNMRRETATWLRDALTQALAQSADDEALR